MSNRVRMRPGKWGTPTTVVALRESATAVAERVDLRETTRGAMSEAPTGRLADVQIIEAGWNTSKSRYYPAAVLARDVPTAYPAGTHMMINHATRTEDEERPEGDLHNLAAVFESTPYTLDGGKTMRVKARIFSPYQQFLAEAWQNIGVSIRGYGEGEQGEAEGHAGTIVTALVEGQSVDFVTHPGAGGRILALLEAARPVKTREATSNELRAALRDALDDAYGENCDSDCCSYVGVNDFDTDKGLVWYCQWGGGDSCMYEQAFTVAMSGEVPVVALADTRTAVVARTQYVPAPAEEGMTGMAESTPDAVLTLNANGRWMASAAGPTWSASTSAPGVFTFTTSANPVREADTPVTPPPVAVEPTDGEPPAATQPIRGEETGVTVSQTTGPAPGAAGTADGTQPVPAAIAEAERARTEAEQARDTALREAADSKQELARLRAVEAARPVASALLAESTLPQAAQNRLMCGVTAATVPLTDLLALDEAAFKATLGEAVKSEAKYLADLHLAEATVREAAGEGRVTGLGGSVAPGADAAKFQTDLAEAFGRIGLSADAAKLAAAGRR